MEKSNCCKAEVVVVGSDEGTNHWECQECHRACDIAPENRGEEKKKEPSPLPPKENWEEIMGAVARGWTYPLNTHKTFDSTLAMGIAKEVLALLQKEKEEAYERGCDDEAERQNNQILEREKIARSTAIDECIATIKENHVRAKTAYTSESWDAGYHDALFDAEKSIIKLTSLHALKEKK